ncbi:MAG: PIN domain-containing protein [Planctomycetota bacterium]|jgi:predicted nucleic acid-binding protein|nr:PIN domain-containing protein [Planctomycetota bacterium]
MLKKPVIYLETSIINYLFDDDKPEKQRDTWRLWNEIKAEKYTVVISDVVLFEINNCSIQFAEKKRKMLTEIGCIRHNEIEVMETPEVVALANAYIDAGGLPPRCKIDALHIAAATTANCDFILSWNFTHIVKLKAMRAVKKVNADGLWKPLEILSPTIFLGEE